MKRPTRNAENGAIAWHELAVDESGSSPAEQVLLAALCAAAFGLFLLVIRR